MQMARILSRLMPTNLVRLKFCD